MNRQILKAAIATLLLTSPAAAEQTNHHLTGLTGLSAAQLSDMSMDQIGTAIRLFRAYSS